MQYAAVIIVGLLAGGVEFFLLSKLIKAVLSGDTKTVVVLAPIKLVILMAAVAAEFFIAPELLWLGGSSIALPLVAGAVYSGLRGIYGKKESKQ